MGSVTGAVVGDHPLDGDLSACEPGHHPLQHAYGSGSFLIDTDLDVRDARMIVDDRAKESSPNVGMPGGGVTGAGASGGLLVPPSLLPAQIPPAATIGDVAELGEIDMDHRAGVIVLVAPDGLDGDAVDLREPVGADADKDRMDRRGRQAKPAGNLDRPQAMSHSLNITAYLAFSRDFGQWTPVASVND